MLAGFRLRMSSASDILRFMKAKPKIPFEVLVLRVTLNYTDPPIWRDVEVPSGLNLHDLHYVIQCIFAWNDSHMYHFLAPPGGKLTRKALREAARYVMPGEEGFGFFEDEDIPAIETTIGNVFTPECKQIVYEYDFCDSWEHLVKLRKRIHVDTTNPVPKCLAGQNAAPFDDIGGIYGYYQLIDALRDSSHEMHDYAIAVFGEDFDPARFDLDIANRRLAYTFKPVPKRTRKPRKKSTT